MQANVNDIDIDIDKDIEQLELYLDHELADENVRRLDERLAAEPSLKASLETLRGQRSRRLSAMSMAFDTDAASIERLVASVRIAQVNESMQRRSIFAFGPQMKSGFAAAACVAFGLLLGVTLQNRHNGATGVIASPSVTNTGAWGITSDASMSAHGTYVVSVKGTDGREVMKVRFPTLEQAQQCIDRLNNPSADAPAVHVGDARILNEPY